RIAFRNPLAKHDLTPGHRKPPGTPGQKAQRSLVVTPAVHNYGPCHIFLVQRAPSKGENLMSRILPPDVSEADFDAALEKFRTALGTEHVLWQPEDLKEFHDPYPTTSEPEFLPGAVVFPETTEEVQ